MNKFKIIVRGAYGMTNFGDDALLKCIHENYLNIYSKEELAYSCTQAKYLRNLVDEYPILPLKENYRNLTQVLIYGGGTQFFSFNRKKSIIEKLFRIIHLILRPKKFVSKISKYIDRNHSPKVYTDDSSHIIMALGIGIGPFLKGSDPRIEHNIKEIFLQMDFVSVRDIYSFNKCKEWGLKNFGIYTDLCFKMEHEKFLKPSSKTNIGKVGVIVRDWNKTSKGDSYKENLLKFSSTIKRKGVDIYFIVFAKDRDKNWIKIINTNNEKLLLWNPDTCTIDSFINTLSAFDIFITARYHGAIFSALLGKPFIGIEVEQKLSLISDLFLKGSHIWTYPFRTEDLIEKFNNINSNYSSFSDEILNKSVEQKRIADNMKNDLKHMLNNIIN